MNQRDEDAAFQHATAEAFRSEAKPFAGPSAEPRPYAADGLPADPILKYFNYEHLPPHLQGVSAQFHLLAHWLVGSLPRCPERTVALRKLLESKDAAVRAALE